MIKYNNYIKITWEVLSFKFLVKHIFIQCSILTMLLTLNVTWNVLQQFFVLRPSPLKIKKQFNTLLQTYLSWFSCLISKCFNILFIYFYNNKMRDLISYPLNKLNLFYSMSHLNFWVSIVEHIIVTHDTIGFPFVNIKLINSWSSWQFWAWNNSGSTISLTTTSMACPWRGSTIQDLGSKVICFATCYFVSMNKTLPRFYLSMWVNFYSSCLWVSYFLSINFWICNVLVKGVPQFLEVLCLVKTQGSAHPLRLIYFPYAITRN